ncbi:hypothetical protein Tco_1506462 [Tanacetum coccineum]
MTTCGIDLDIWRKASEHGKPYVRKKQVKMKGYFDAKVQESHLDQGTSCIELTTQATRKTQEGWDQSGKDPTRLRKHLEKEHTSCVTWMGVSSARGPHVELSANLRNAIFSKVLTGSVHEDWTKIGTAVAPRPGLRSNQAGAQRPRWHAHARLNSAIFTLWVPVRKALFQQPFFIPVPPPLRLTTSQVTSHKIPKDCLTSAIPTVLIGSQGANHGYCATYALQS